MTSFIKHYQDWVLVSVAALLVGVIVGFYIWGTDVLLTHLTQAISSGGTAAPTVEFNIDGAQKILSARGLLQ